MWRGLSTACSRYTVGSPNADSASRLAASIASGNASASVTRRIPRPPPPATALTNNGNSISADAATNSSTDDDGADDVSTGRPAFTRRGDRARLVTGQRKHLGFRADEGDALLRAFGGQLRVLRQEPVAGVHRVGAGTARGVHDLADRQIRPDRVADLADLVRLVGLQAVQRISVFVGVDSDGADAEFVGRAKRPDRRSRRDWQPALWRSTYVPLRYSGGRLFRSAWTSSPRTGPQSAERRR